jgi:hypothetical protein
MWGPDNRNQSPTGVSVGDGDNVAADATLTRRRSV